MANSKAAIKTRIKSINTTKKITGAMELISNIKLQKQIRVLNKNLMYANTMKEVVDEIMSSGEIESKYTIKNDVAKRLVFVFLSDLGLCGGYNVNILKYLKANYTADDLLCVVGSHGGSFFEKNGFKLLNKEIILSDEVEFNDLKKLMNQALEMYINKEIGSVEIVYTKFVNNVTFTPDTTVVLPFKADESHKEHREVLFEPNVSEIANLIIPLIANNILFNRFVQAKTSEQGSRRFAMENATDNANELIENLTLVYNQARQAAITQEITEIIGGADAL